MSQIRSERSDDVGRRAQVLAQYAQRPVSVSAPSHVAPGAPPRCQILCKSQLSRHGEYVRFGSKAEVRALNIDVRFSNRHVRVTRFQTIHHDSVDVAHGLVLLFGIGTKALPSWGSKTRWNNLYRDLAIRRTAGPSGHTNSPHPSSREGHLSTARWSSRVLLS